MSSLRLDVDNLSAEINLAAEVASLVTINAGVQVGVTRVNITIVDVEAELELIVRLGNCKALSVSCCGYIPPRSG